MQSLEQLTRCARALPLWSLDLWWPLRPSERQPSSLHCGTSSLSLSSMAYWPKCTGSCRSWRSSWTPRTMVSAEILHFFPCHFSPCSYYLQYLQNYISMCDIVTCDWLGAPPLSVFVSLNYILSHEWEKTVGTDSRCPESEQEKDDLNCSRRIV